MSTDYFHNISVVNTQYERILINAIMAILLQDIQPWKWVYFSQVHLFDCWRCIWENFCGIHISSLSAFQFTVLISSDLQWLAKLVLVVQLWSLHKISDQKRKLSKVSGELWEVCGLMVIALVSECQAVWVQALAGDIVLCSGTQHFTLSVPLSLGPGV